MMKHIRWSLLLILLTGCAASGTQVTENQLSFLEPGKTSIQDAVATLGQPNMNMRNPDGTRTIAYIYSEAAARPETFIPIVGAFVGGMDIRSNMVMLQFDRSGKLMSHSASSSAIGTGTNLSSGTTSNRIDGQPKQAK